MILNLDWEARDCLTLNQRVAGSSPASPTKFLFQAKDLRPSPSWAADQPVSNIGNISAFQRARNGVSNSQWRARGAKALSHRPEGDGHWLRVGSSSTNKRAGGAYVSSHTTKEASPMNAIEQNLIGKARFCRAFR